jgi:hypothetical protein
LYAIGVPDPEPPATMSDARPVLSRWQPLGILASIAGALAVLTLVALLAIWWLIQPGGWLHDWALRRLR